MNDIERLGVPTALEYFKQTHYQQNKKTAMILDFFHQRYCSSKKFCETLKEANPQITFATTDIDRDIMQANHKIDWIHPEQLLKDMWLRYERLDTLSFVFIPIRRGWRLEQTDSSKVQKNCKILKNLLMDEECKYHDQKPMSAEAQLYESLIGEYMMLIADIEVGLIAWNKFRLQAYQVKDLDEVYHYVMY